MRLNTLISFIGFIVLIAATYCPILRPFHLVNWDVYDGSKPYGIVILLIAVVGIIGTIFNEFKIIRLCAWLSLALVIIFFMLTLLKLHTSFSFIPFHSLDAYLIKQIKFKWGWSFLVIGPLMGIAGVYLRKDQENLHRDS